MYIAFVILAMTINLSSLQARSVDLRSEMTSVKHQGARGTCSAFAASGLMEFLISQRTGEDVDLSEQYNYWATKTYALTNHMLQSSYENSDGHAGFMAVETYQLGSMLESEWEYENYNWFQLNDIRCNQNNLTKECFTGAIPEGAERIDYKIKPQYIEISKIGEFLLTQKRPVVINVTWYFEAVNKNGDFHMPTQKDLEGAVGGHVILLVGYDSRTEQFIFKNSYGENWGNNGYGTMPRKYIENYYEIKDSMPYFNQYNSNEKEFLLKASKGVSGILVDQL